jgi:hypothetical protein
MVNPEKISLTKFDIRTGSSNWPRVTALIAYRDYVHGQRMLSPFLNSDSYQFVDNYEHGQ